MRYLDGRTGQYIEERIGVHHLVSGWIQQCQVEKASFTFIAIHEVTQSYLIRDYTYQPHGPGVESAWAPS